MGYNVFMIDVIQHTALDLPVEEWQAFHPLQVIRQRQVSAQAELSRRRRRALRLARQAAVLLRQNFGASRVTLFGSLASRGSFTLWSDIDLAVWGVAPARFYAAVAAVTGLSTEFNLDLVDAETCPASLRRAITQEGIDL